MRRARPEPVVAHLALDAARHPPAPTARHPLLQDLVQRRLVQGDHLWLAATAEGLGVGWVSFYREEFLADLVGLPDGVRPVAWLCLGPVDELQEVPDLVRHGWRRGRDLDDAIHLDRWSA